MLTLPAELLPLIVEFAPLFSKPVWEHAQVLLVGTILAPGKRTVTACLRVMGLSQEKRVMLQICTHAPTYAILASYHEGGQNGAHPRALSPLPKRSGHQRR